MQIRNLIVLISGLLLVLLTPSMRGVASPPVFETEEQNMQGDYTTVIRSGDDFVAASHNGRIDWFSDAGEITKSVSISELKLNSLLAVDPLIIAAGDNGSMLIGSELETFKKIESGTLRNINSLVFFNGKVIAAADEGELVIGNVNGSFETTQLELKGNIVSISANTTDCYGVTDKGEIIHSKDGINWGVFDFNKKYEGFYKPCQFTKVIVTEKQISIIGKQDDGMPVMFYSSRGTVWTQRNLEFTDQDGVSLLIDIPNDIYYDVAKDQFILVCNQGKMMIIPSCSHCNKLFEISSANLKGIAGNDNSLIVVGEGGYLKTERIDNF